MRYFDMLHPDGILAIDRAETLTGFQLPFKTAQASEYTK